MIIISKPPLYQQISPLPKSGTRGYLFFGYLNFKKMIADETKVKTCLGKAVCGPDDVVGIIKPDDIVFR